MADYSKMKVVELKAELKRLGLPQNGLKAELVARLEEATASEDDPTAASGPPPEPTATAEPDEAQPSEDAEPASDTPELPRVETTQEPQAGSAATIAQDSSASDVPAQTTSSANVSETPSLPTAEVVQDVQKRKRRSTTRHPPKRLCANGCDQTILMQPEMLPQTLCLVVMKHRSWKTKRLITRQW